MEIFVDFTDKKQYGNNNGNSKAWKNRIKILSVVNGEKQFDWLFSETESHH